MKLYPPPIWNFLGTGSDYFCGEKNGFKRCAMCGKEFPISEIFVVGMINDDDGICSRCLPEFEKYVGMPFEHYEMMKGDH